MWPIRGSLILPEIVHEPVEGGCGSPDADSSGSGSTSAVGGGDAPFCAGSGPEHAKTIKADVATPRMGFCHCLTNT